MCISEVIYSIRLANFGMKRTQRNYLKGNKKPTIATIRRIYILSLCSFSNPCADNDPHVVTGEKNSPTAAHVGHKR
jgi:hypothetical protein